MNMPNSFFHDLLRPSPSSTRRSRVDEPIAASIDVLSRRSSGASDAIDTLERVARPSPPASGASHSALHAGLERAQMLSARGRPGATLRVIEQLEALPGAETDWALHLIAAQAGIEAMNRLQAEGVLGRLEVRPHGKRTALTPRVTGDWYDTYAGIIAHSRAFLELMAQPNQRSTLSLEPVLAPRCLGDGLDADEAEQLALAQARGDAVLAILDASQAARALDEALVLAARIAARRPEIEAALVTGLLRPHGVEAAALARITEHPLYGPLVAATQPLAHAALLEGIDGAAMWEDWLQERACGGHAHSAQPHELRLAPSHHAGVCGERLLQPGLPL